MTPDERDRFEDEYSHMSLEGLKMSRIIVGLRLAQVLYGSCTVSDCKALFRSIQARINRKQTPPETPPETPASEIEIEID